MITPRRPVDRKWRRRLPREFARYFGVHFPLEDIDGSLGCEHLFQKAMSASHGRQCISRTTRMFLLVNDDGCSGARHACAFIAEHRALADAAPHKNGQCRD